MYCFIKLWRNKYLYFDFNFFDNKKKKVHIENNDNNNDLCKCCYCGEQSLG